VSEHASEREKLAITASYYRNVTGELDKALQIQHPALHGDRSSTSLLRQSLGIYLKNVGDAPHVINLEGVRLVALELGLPQLGDGDIAGDPVDAVDVAVLVVVMQNPHFHSSPPFFSH
jgi:hypothetical protein